MLVAAANDFHRKTQEAETAFNGERSVSTRTIIEINHDELSRLLNNQNDFLNLLKALHGSEIAVRLNNGELPYFGSGLYVLAQRHHSERIKLPSKPQFCIGCQQKEQENNELWREIELLHARLQK